jgi:hypothetical protein
MSRVSKFFSCLLLLTILAALLHHVYLYVVDGGLANTGVGTVLFMGFGLIGIVYLLLAGIYYVVVAPRPTT